MNPKQARFVQEYLIDPNATQAAIRAGYAPGSAHVQGCRLLSNVKIANQLQLEQAALAERAEVTQEWLVEEYKENHRLAREGNPTVNRYGKPTGQVMRQIGASNKALESIAVLTGHWVQKDKPFDGNLTINIVQFSGRTP